MAGSHTRGFWFCPVELAYGYLAVAVQHSVRIDIMTRHLPCRLRAQGTAAEGKQR